MTSCCRKAPKALPNPRDFCASLSMATPVIVEQQGADYVITVQTPGGERARLQDALQNHQCKANSTSGIRIASLAISALHRVVALGRTSSLPVSRQLPLLMLKDTLYRLVERCAACKGSGCTACGGTGFLA
jgi:hypothetical protein